MFSHTRLARHYNSAMRGLREMDSLGSENRDGMRIDWGFAIPMDDGVFIRADIFRPVREARCPVIMSYTGYGKNLRSGRGLPRGMG